VEELFLDQFARLPGAAVGISQAKPDGQWNCKSFGRISEEGNIVYESFTYSA
jgi:hypothetical protein